VGPCVKTSGELTSALARGAFPPAAASSYRSVGAALVVFEFGISALPLRGRPRSPARAGCWDCCLEATAAAAGQGCCRRSPSV
jgi:hypothetical protein